MASLQPFMTKNFYAQKDIEVHFNKGDVVELHGLNKVEWNGKQAVIIGDVIIKENMRRWPIQLKHQISVKASIKECNMKAIGKITVIYEAKLSDPVDEHIEKSFVFQHQIDKHYLNILCSNKKKSLKYLERIAKSHHDEMFSAYKWHCTECHNPATKLQLHPIAYLSNPQPVIIEMAGPTCDNMAWQKIHN
eukprot:UN08021